MFLPLTFSMPLFVTSLDECANMAVDAAPLHLCRKLLMGSNPLHYDRLDVAVTLLFFVRTGMRMALYVRIFVLHGN
jgi:hypothetical protein